MTTFKPHKEFTGKHWAGLFAVINGCRFHIEYQNHDTDGAYRVWLPNGQTALIDKHLPDAIST